MSDFQVIWQPQPGPQSWLLACPVFEVFYGGARGGGKTDGMLGDFASHASLYGSSAVGLLVRRELTQLKELIARSHEIYGPIGAKWHTQDKMWTFPNGARLTLAYLDNDQDADRYQGSSFSRVYVEEIGNFPSPTPIFKLMACIRSANADVRVGFRASGNPGGVGHAWLKERYITPAPLGKKVLRSEYKNPFTGEMVQRERVFIPAKVTDNQYLNTDEYIATLQMAGNDQLVKAWLTGNWDIFIGSFFTEWDSDVHVIPQFYIPTHWTRFVSFDWGSARPFALGWFAIVPDRFEAEVISDNPYVYHNHLPRGAMVMYREWYGCARNSDGGAQPNVGLKLTIEEVANGIRARESREPKGDNGRARIAYRIAGLDLFKQDGGPSLAERMGGDLVWQRCDNARVPQKGAVGGWDQVRARLRGEDGQPMLYFFDNCIDAIRTIPALPHDANRLEDVDTEAEDHAGDMVRYACMSRPYSRLLETKGPDRIFSVGPCPNGVLINDVMDDIWKAPKPAPRYERIA